MASLLLRIFSFKAMEFSLMGQNMNLARPSATGSSRNQNEHDSPILKSRKIKDSRVDLGNAQSHLHGFELGIYNGAKDLGKNGICEILLVPRGRVRSRHKSHKVGTLGQDFEDWEF